MNGYFQVQACFPNTLQHLSRLGLSYPEHHISVPFHPTACLSLAFLSAPSFCLRAISLLSACPYFMILLDCPSNFPELFLSWTLTLILPMLHAQHMVARLPSPTTWETHSLSCSRLCSPNGSCPSDFPAESSPFTGQPQPGKSSLNDFHPYSFLL